MGSRKAEIVCAGCGKPLAESANMRLTVMDVGIKNRLIMASIVIKKLGESPLFSEEFFLCDRCARKLINAIRGVLK